MVFDPRAFVESMPWRFARTMPTEPHEYVVSGKDVDDAALDAFAAYMAEHGYRARWRRKAPNTYCDLDGWRYWILPGRDDQTVRILNRERLPGASLTAVD